MLCTAGERRENLGRSGCVPQRNGDIAQPSFIADAPNGAAFGLLQELVLAPPEQVGELRMIQSMTHGEILFRCRLGELVPRANQLAIIAAVNAISHGAPKLDRDTA